VLLTVAIPVFEETQGLLDAAISDPVSCVVEPAQTVRVPVMVGGVQVEVEILITPVSGDKKYVSFLLVATELVLPQKPSAPPAPPNVKVPAVEEVPFANDALAVPLIERLLLIVRALEMVFVPLPESMRLL
jgi:hypothetical protein